MRIVVTGASGFIGSALAKKLVEQGHDVYGIYRYVADGRYDFYQLDRKIICDVRDRAGIDEAIGKVKPEVVYHLAAITPVSISFLYPLEVTEVNYLGTMNIADACVKHRVAHLINASTSEFYGKQDKFPITEDATPRPMSPYAVAKLAAEEYLWFKRRIENLPFTTIRPYNTYNRSNVKKKYFVIERAITQALEEGHIHLFTPYPVRDLLERDDHVSAYLKCLGNTKIIGEAINIGTGEGHTIGEAVELVARLVGGELGKEIPVSWDMAPDRPFDIATLICSNNKALQLLGWKPSVTLEEGLHKAVREWREVLGL